MIGIKVASAPGMRGPGIGGAMRAPAGWAVIDRRTVAAGWAIGDGWTISTGAVATGECVTRGTGIARRTIATWWTIGDGWAVIPRRALCRRWTDGLLRMCRFNLRSLLRRRAGWLYGGSLWRLLRRLSRAAGAFLCSSNGANRRGQQTADGQRAEYPPEGREKNLHSVLFCYEWYDAGCGGRLKLRFFFSFSP